MSVDISKSFECVSVKCTQEIVCKAEARSPIYQSHVDEERGAHGPRPAHIQQVFFVAKRNECTSMFDCTTWLVCVGHS